MAGALTVSGDPVEACTPSLGTRKHLLTPSCQDPSQHHEDGEDEDGDRIHQRAWHLGSLVVTGGQMG